MSDSQIGLYDTGGNAIIQYNRFNSLGVDQLYISTGFGSAGIWKMSFGHGCHNMDVTADVTTNVTAERHDRCGPRHNLECASYGHNYCIGCSSCILHDTA